MYEGDNPDANLYLGKIYSQNLHNWHHWSQHPKGRYYHKDHNGSWYFFYETLHNNLPNEKMVSWINIGRGGGSQMWKIIYNEILIDNYT